MCSTTALLLLLAAVVLMMHQGTPQPPSLAATTTLDSSASASTVCVYNDAAFDLKWALEGGGLIGGGAYQGTLDGINNVWGSGEYPVGQSRCINGNSLDVPNGTPLAPVVAAYWGKTKTMSNNPVIFDAGAATVVSYTCTGTTLDFKCAQGKPPITSAAAAKDFELFAAGFADALYIDSGFSKCFSDLDSLYTQIKSVASSLAGGFNKLSKSSIVTAFETIAKILEVIYTAVTDCKAAAGTVADTIQDVATAVANPLDLIKIAVDEVMTITTNYGSLTTDAQNMATSWEAGAYETTGFALGNITAVLIKGL
jgi:hypothetical protein